MQLTAVACRLEGLLQLDGRTDPGALCGSSFKPQTCPCAKLVPLWVVMASETCWVGQIRCLDTGFRGGEALQDSPCASVQGAGYHACGLVPAAMLSCTAPCAGAVGYWDSHMIEFDLSPEDAAWLAEVNQGQSVGCCKAPRHKYCEAPRR